MSKCFGEVNKNNRRSSEKNGPGKKEAPKKILFEWWYGDPSSIESYYKSKIKMLRKDMQIEPTVEEIRHLRSLKTVIAIDNAVHNIIERHWSEF